MYCKYCGNKIDDDSVFCKYCGRKFSGGSPLSGGEKGHEWVDLGLSVRWATCNVGATYPFDYGGYYSWGKTYTQSAYGSEYYYVKRNIMENISGSEYDVAHTKWRGTWRIPTKEEQQELIDKCVWTWTSQEGHNGYKVTGPSGGSIFLPAAGKTEMQPVEKGDTIPTLYVNVNGLEFYKDDVPEKNGCYWSASRDEERLSGAFAICFYKGNEFDVEHIYAYVGATIRPVTDPDEVEEE